MKKIYLSLALLLAINILANENMQSQDKNTKAQDKYLVTANGCGNNQCNLPNPIKNIQNHSVKRCNCMLCGFNAPVSLQGCSCFEYYTKAAFIFWQPLEEGLTFATKSDNLPTDSFVGPLLGTKVVDIDFNYKPGFKVGVGLRSGHDNWDVYFQYTWFHLTKSQKEVEPKNGRLLFYPWFNDQNVQQGNTFLATKMKAFWELDMDFLDLELSRSYYVGRKLTFRPFIGARGSWINQSMEIDANVLNIGLRKSKIKSDSWALGARGGLDTNWIIKRGFRTFGNFATSLLYTNYHKLMKNEDAINSSIFGKTFLHATNKFNYLRTNLEFTLGFGWGTYFSNYSNHFDLAIGYDFNVYFNQNMLRFYSDEFASEIGIEHPASNLYTHGLNVAMQVDF